MEGESMSEWKEVRLGDVGKIVGGATPSTRNPQNYGGVIPWITPKDLSINKERFIEFGERNISEQGLNSCSAKMLPKGSILFSSRAPIGYVAIAHTSLCTNQGFKSFVPDTEKMDSMFSYYLLKHNSENIANLGSGTTFMEVSGKVMSDYIVNIPDLSTQQEIAGILSSLDAKIETNNKLNEKLEEMAQAIFKSWFVDFEPFKDKPFHDTELGMIPEGWEVKRLCDIVDNIGGYSYKGNELKESTTAMCTIKNFERNGGFKIDGYKEIIPSDKLKESQELTLFDVVVAHTDLTQNAEVIGNPAIILSKSNYDRIIFSMDLTKVISKNMNVSKSLLYCILRNKRFKNHALGYVNGTTVLHMSKKAVPDYMLAFPKDSAILVSLSKCFDSIFGRMHEIYEENDRLASLRDTLLPRLMSGELIV